MNWILRALRFVSRTQIITIAGWSPGLCALATSQQLPCGCIVGIYHSWSGHVVAVIDAAADHCRYQHHVNLVLGRQQFRECGLEVSPRLDQRQRLDGVLKAGRERAVTEQQDVRTRFEADQRRLRDEDSRDSNG